jgi:preprotein translocase subunit SecE
VTHANPKVTEMEIKKPQSSSDTKSLHKRSIVEFGREVKQELKKIDWTTKSELSSYTKIVVASMFLFGFAIYLVDLIIQGMLGGINVLFKIFTG